MIHIYIYMLRPPPWSTWSTLHSTLVKKSLHRLDIIHQKLFMRMKFYYRMQVLLWEGNSIMEKVYYEKEVLVSKTYFYYEKEALWEGSSVMEKKFFSYKEASVWKRSFFSVKQVLLWENISIMRRKFFRKKSSIMRRKFYYGTSFIMRRKFHNGKTFPLRKGRSIMEKELLYEVKFSLWKKECYYEKEVLFWKESSTLRSSIVEKRVLLREGSSIGENKFSYDKEVSRKFTGNSIVRRLFFCGKKEFYHEEVRLWNKFHSKNKVLTENNSIVKRKFYFEKKTLERNSLSEKEALLWKKSSFMRRKLYIKKIVFYYKKEIRI